MIKQTIITRNYTKAFSESTGEPVLQEVEEFGDFVSRISDTINTYFPDDEIVTINYIRGLKKIGKPKGSSAMDDILYAVIARQCNVEKPIDGEVLSELVTSPYPTTDDMRALLENFRKEIKSDISERLKSKEYEHMLDHLIEHRLDQFGRELQHTRYC